MSTGLSDFRDRFAALGIVGLLLLATAIVVVGGLWAIGLGICWLAAVPC